MKKYIASHEYVFFLLFVFAQLIGSILKINTKLDGTIHLTKYMLLGIFLMSAILAYPLSTLSKKWLDHFLDQEKTDNKKLFTRKGIYMWLYLWLGISAMWIPYLLAYYPGIFAYDIPSQWNQYFGVSGYNTQHPIIHTILMGWEIEVGQRIFGNYNKGVAFYCLLQLLVLSGVISYAICYVNRLTSSRRIIIFVILYFALFPVWPILGISTTKDTYFAVFYFMSFMALLNCCFSGIKTNQIISAVFFLTAGLLFRNNAVHGVVLAALSLVLLMMIKQYPKREGLYFVTIFFFCVFISAGLFGQLKRITNASEVTIAESLSIPCQQIARVYSEKKNELTEDDQAVIFQYIPEEKLVNYRWQLSDPVKAGLNTRLVESDWKRFIALWLEFGKRYPGEYLEATLCNTLPLWYVWDESMVSVKHCYIEYSFFDFTSGKVVKNSQFPGLEKILTNTCTKGYILEFPIVSLLFAPALYVWIIIAIGFILAKYKQYKYLVLPSFLLGYVATLMAGPCILPRYCINFIICVPVLMICTGNILRRERDEGINYG